MSDSYSQNLTSTSEIIIFPEKPSNGDIHNHSGVDYVYENGRWVVIPIDVEQLLEGRFVRVPGDTMTGALSCPMFTGHYDLDSLKELPA